VVERTLVRCERVIQFARQLRCLRRIDQTLERGGPFSLAQLDTIAYFEK
jgi:hypothetical protein